MYQEKHSLISDSSAYHPSALRWIGATCATVVLAPILVSIPLVVVGPFFMTDYTFINVITAVFGLPIMALVFGTPVAIIPVGIASIVSYLLFRLYKIRSLLIYILNGSVVTFVNVLTWRAPEFGLENVFVSSPQNLWGNFTFSVYASSPAAIAYWLMVWWPLIKQKRSRYKNTAVSENEAGWWRRRLGEKYELGRTNSRQSEGRSEQQKNTLGKMSMKDP